LRAVQSDLDFQSPTTLALFVLVQAVIRVNAKRKECTTNGRGMSRENTVSPQRRGKAGINITANNFPRFSLRARFMPFAIKVIYAFSPVS
jgi:hypothetical protein